MSQYCCIKQCRKRRKDGVSLFRFPHKRENHLKQWLQNIGDSNFKPEKSHVICSAHFQEKDFLNTNYGRYGTNGILLKYGAVPSIFPVPQTALENSTANSPTTSAVQENISMNVSATTEYHKVQRKGIMSSNTFHFKNQELTPSERELQREIKTLKAKVRRRDKKILSLQNLLQELR